jgi:hypothetical protein
MSVIAIVTNAFVAVCLVLSLVEDRGQAKTALRAACRGGQGGARACDEEEM